MLHTASLPGDALRTGLDRAYRTRLTELVAGSGLDGALLLAQDLPHDDFGDPLPDRAGFYVPNDYLLRVCRESEGRFLPAVSIHPYRRDALHALARCIEGGAKVVKLLPNCHNADCSHPRTREFWRMMAEAKLLLLAHTGGEYSVPVLRRELESPETLRLPLETGVTCIAAHGAGASAPWGIDYADTLLALFREYPHLYADNSALASPNRAGQARVLLRPEVVDRVIHGTDFPIPVGAFGPWVRGMVPTSTLRRAGATPNPFARDVLIKRAMGFPPETLTRLSGLLRRD